MKRWILAALWTIGAISANAQVPAAQPASLVYTDQFIEENLVNLYPNPVIDILNIQVRPTGTGKLYVQVKDVIGKTIYKNTSAGMGDGTYVFQVYMPNAARGMYLYHITDDKGDVVATGKFVKQ